MPDRETPTKLKARIGSIASRAKRSASNNILSHLAGAAVALTYVASERAAAQSFGGAGEVACSAGAGKIVPLAVGGLALYLIIVGAMTTLAGFNDTKSKQGKSRAGGRDKMRSGGKTMAGGLLGPGLLAAGLDALGVNLGCLSFDLGILFILV